MQPTPDAMDTPGTITCPVCSAQAQVPIPTDACLFFFDCPSCAARIRPKQGDCCVFCSYGDRACPSRSA
jgi:hypothetical protein